MAKKDFVYYSLILIIVASLSALSGALVGGYAVYNTVSDHLSGNPVLVNDEEVSSQLVPVSNKIVDLSITDYQTTITNAVENIGPAVVTIIGIVPGRSTFFGVSPDQPVSGSGVIISEVGHILTNNHVIENTLDISVILADGTELPAEVLGTDVFVDLAVLKVDGENFTIATLGNSDKLKPGETVIAIGSPLGDFKNTVTVGVVSATERVLDTDKGYKMEGLIQTDAAINQGNSGGPLVNLAGEVIGINTLIVRGNGFGGTVVEGLGFSIPSNRVRAVSEQIIDKGYFSYPYLGIRWQWISASMASNYDLPVENGGVYIAQVEKDSPAEISGLESGDIITRLGDIELGDDSPFINALYSYAPGDTVKIIFIRESETLDTTIQLVEHPVP